MESKLSFDPKIQKSRQGKVYVPDTGESDWFDATSEVGEFVLSKR